MLLPFELGMLGPIVLLVAVPAFGGLLFSNPSVPLFPFLHTFRTVSMQIILPACQQDGYLSGGTFYLPAWC